MLTLIAARAQGGAIGRGNTIPWHAPEDLAAFQRETTGGALIMGRRTWDSLPVRPLKGRLNCVVSSDKGMHDAVFADPFAALAHAQAAGYTRVYGIGGAAIYAALLPVAHRLLLTEVEVAVEDADTFFPAFNPGDWQEIARLPLREAAPACVLHEYLRR